ncbi:Hypothetical protein UVM_LOCUS399 [uncultured virus]|nr:Hypothetical protein UVM_LOCUS399 [uncultured virus]
MLRVFVWTNSYTGSGSIAIAETKEEAIELLMKRVDRDKGNELLQPYHDEVRNELTTMKAKVRELDGFAFYNGKKSDD